MADHKLKYASLSDVLSRSEAAEITLGFDEIAAAVGPLPPSAYEPQFWANVRGHHVSRRSAWQAVGYDAFLLAGDAKVRFVRQEEGANPSNAEEDWTDEELLGCVTVYRRLQIEESAGGRPNKTDARVATLEGPLRGRSGGAYEWRMQNISAVLDELGLPWIKGYKPAVKVGRTKARIISMINAVWGRAKVPEAKTSDPAGFDTRVISALQKQASSPADTPPPVGSEGVTAVVSGGLRYVRDPEVAAWVLAQAAGVCEVCRTPAPFLREDGRPFLEVHHLRPLAEGGPDTVDNTLATCPNCHRELHYGVNKARLGSTARGKIPRLKKHPKRERPTRSGGAEDGSA